MSPEIEDLGRDVDEKKAAYDKAYEAHRDTLFMIALKVEMAIAERKRPTLMDLKSWFEPVRRALEAREDTYAVYQIAYKKWDEAVKEDNKKRAAAVAQAVAS